MSRRVSRRLSRRRVSRGLSRRAETLQHQCMQFILMHLEEIPPSYLALLPLSIRKKILYRLPVADVCLLEETPFVDGLDLEAYWSDCLEDLEVYLWRDLSEDVPLIVWPDYEKICKAKWGQHNLLRLVFIQELQGTYLISIPFLLAYCLPPGMLLQEDGGES